MIHIKKLDGMSDDVIAYASETSDLDTAQRRLQDDRVLWLLERRAAEAVLYQRAQAFLSAEWLAAEVAAQYARAAADARRGAVREAVSCDVDEEESRILAAAFGCRPVAR